MATTLALVLASGLMAMQTLHADGFGSGANAFSVDFVTVGDPGNAADTGTTGSYFAPNGGVAYEFRIGTHEISRDMIAKASTMGSLGITLWDMTSFGGNVGTHPATGVSWNEAARFVNWLNTSTGHQAAYKFALQPGDAGYDANANINLWTVADAGYDSANPYRNALAYYFLPSEDEWYKAAYYSGSGTTYYDYALGSDTIPTAVAGGVTGVVYSQSLSTGPVDIDIAGGPSYYGTEGQNGNVMEWMESAVNAPNDSPSETRSFRGGFWYFSESALRSSNQFWGDPSYEDLIIGFRVASVPEPTAAMRMFVAGGALLCRRRRALQFVNGSW